MKYEKTIFEQVTQHIDMGEGEQPIYMSAEFCNGEMSNFQWETIRIDPRNIEHLNAVVQFLNRTIALFK